VCRSIRKHDWEPLLTFLEEKRVRVTNLEQARQGPGFAPNMPLDGMTALDGADDNDEDDDNFGQVRQCSIPSPFVRACCTKCVFTSSYMWENCAVPISSYRAFADEHLTRGAG
jgi:hypothetical protein